MFFVFLIETDPTSNNMNPPCIIKTKVVAQNKKNTFTSSSVDSKLINFLLIIILLSVLILFNSIIITQFGVSALALALPSSLDDKQNSLSYCFNNLTKIPNTELGIERQRENKELIIIKRLRNQLSDSLSVSVLPI